VIAGSTTQYKLDSAVKPQNDPVGAVVSLYYLYSRE